jgi:hypothetical protein
MRTLLMSGIGIFGIIALIVIMIALLGWVLAVIRADHDPVQTKEPGGKLKRGPVSGGAIRGDPGQNILTGEAPRQDEHPRDGPMDL